MFNRNRDYTDFNENKNRLSTTSSQPDYQYVLREDGNVYKERGQDPFTVKQPTPTSGRLEKQHKYFTPEQIQKMLYHMDGLEDKAYFLLHINTGLRISDVLGIRVENFDWEHNRVWVEDKKKDKWRYVYFPATIASVLQQYIERIRPRRLRTPIGSGKLFHLSPRTYNRRLKKYASLAGLPRASRVSSHWCRHTYVRLSRRAGRDLMAVAHNTGDTIKTILSWYSVLDEGELERQANAFDLAALSSNTQM